LTILQATTPNVSCTIGLNGPPGVGKTEFAKVYAEMLSLPFVHISLGGMRDSNILKGSSGLYIGSDCSIILTHLAEVGVANPVILFDELDKLSSHENNSVQNTLLHIIDPTTNNKFNDCYLTDITHNLSYIRFMFSMNSTEDLSPPLRDRLRIINIPSYTKTELITIVKDYLLVRNCKKMNFEKEQIILSESVLSSFISFCEKQNAYTGVRTLNRHIENMIKKLCVCKIVDVETRQKIGASPSLLNIEFPFVCTLENMKDLCELTENKITVPTLSMYI
jgi:ATP-dependent Lon protease